MADDLKKTIDDEKLIGFGGGWDMCLNGAGKMPATLVVVVVDGAAGGGYNAGAE